MGELKREVIIKGKPNIQNMPKDTAKIFYAALLKQIKEHYVSDNQNMTMVKGLK